ncbi:hypothetical protein Palpr_1618 [Paludibacter propionicigenes WB4]|uniref:Uncharacterized protein n=1 Tax=Paludibacter propionicigenes (strain DSM 17365 / JCM 13257 / WB4) TaxID=694427 RepID=E4T4W7_PALPW|nr:hypothetical protein Palpr_1618 [Paludibacter propionicigenes WB4]
MTAHLFSFLGFYTLTLFMIFEDSYHLEFITFYNLSNLFLNSLRQEFLTK